MKVWLENDIYQRATACAGRAKVVFTDWGGMACRKHGGCGTEKLVADRDACSLATINADDITQDAARNAIRIAVEYCELMDAKNPPWFGVETARCVIMKEEAA